MVNYRRNRVPGGTYFFTVTLHDRRSTLLTDHIDLLRNAFDHTRKIEPFHIDAVAVLPDHLHAVWTLPQDDHDYSGRWRAVKARFTRSLKKTGCLPASADGYGIWQSRFWEHTIRNDLDLQRHVDYIHFNPVKHGHVLSPVDWPYSSIHRYIRNGVLAPDWGASMPIDVAGKFGE